MPESASRPKKCKRDRCGARKGFKPLRGSRAARYLLFFLRLFQATDLSQPRLADNHSWASISGNPTAWIDGPEHIGDTPRALPGRNLAGIPHHQ